jgi:signal transduction histidine kinase
VAPDLLLLGGTDVDVASLYEQTQRSLRRFKSQIDELSISYNSKTKQIENLNQEILTRNQEIEKQSREIENQKKLFEEQMLRSRLQQEQMDANEIELANVLEELEVKQQTLDSKIDLIRNQEDEISTQRAEIENRNAILQEQEDEIQIQEKKIKEQVSQLSNFANTVARQRIFLYIAIAVCFLIGGLVFFIYRSYKTKKDANREIELKNRELQLRHEEVQHANEEVLATNEALEVQKKELQLALENLKTTQSQLIDAEKMASVGLLTAGIAHELNNPINFVSGSVNPLRRNIKDLLTLLGKYDDLVTSKGLSEEFEEVNVLKDKLDYTYVTKEISNLLEGIVEGANRSSQIVKGLRSFSRLDEEKCQIYDIHEGIESSLILLHNKIKNRITIRRDYGEFEHIECYPSKLNQVVMNILTNSIQAIKEKGEIHIKTVSSDTGVKISIKDNGRGMTPEVKKHIFEPFFTTKEVGKGTGLGLSISFGIIEQHNGDIDVISEPGKGTEFIITLPKTQAE